jgi:phage baseplate assembly protein W
MIETSFSFPNMFDVSRSKVNIYTDVKAITNRVKLLMLTDPTELHMVPNFGLGLRKYMYSYNNDNTIALIRDQLIEQLRLWEPAVIPEDTIVERGLLYTETNNEGTIPDIDHLKLTVTLTTADLQKVTFGVTLSDFSRSVS